MADHGINLPGGTEYPGTGAPPDDALLYIYGPPPLKGHWITVGRLRDGLSGGGNTPAPTPLAVSFSIGSSSRQPGQNLTFGGTAYGGTPPYTHLVQATNLSSGAVTDIGTATATTYNGVWQNLPAGEFSLTDTVTDSTGAVKVSTARRLTVQASGSTDFSATVDAQRNTTLTPASGAAYGDYEYQFRQAPTVSEQRSVDMSQFLASGESAGDYEYQFRPS